ncbi:MAG TPA: SIMPL domain-containing protein [Rhizomicrobium sp.]|jgi:hypothetical protein
MPGAALGRNFAFDRPHASAGHEGVQNMAETRARSFHGKAILSAAMGFAVLGAPSALADGTPGPRTISVSGQGDIKAPPDQASLSSGVVTQARTAADALAGNTRAMNAVFATLKRLGIPDKQIQTSDFSVTPQYPPDRAGSDTGRITGYRVSNEVTATVDLAKLGPALDALVAAGSNSIGNIAFAIRDPKPLLAAARAAAVADAIARAQTYAKAGGVSLGPILSISEAGAEEPHPVYRMAMAPMSAAAPVAGGQESIDASVNVTFQIR